MERLLKTNAEGEDEVGDTLPSPPRFDNWQFEHYFGARRAGTVVNNALPSEFFRKGRKEAVAIDANFADIRKKMIKKK